MVLHGGGPETLMASIELPLIQLIYAITEFRRCLLTSEALSLGNNLIHERPTKRNIIEWNKSQNEFKAILPVW